MPILPGADNLGQREFQDRSQAIRPQIDISGQANFIDAAQKVTSSISDRLDQSALHKAKIEFQKAKLEADSAFDQDADFATHETRYNETLGKAVESSAKLLKNPELQERFKLDVSLYQIEGANNIKKRAFMKETDQGLANLGDSLTMARENYLRSSNPADKEFSRQSMMDSIDTAQQSKYIDADKAQALRQKAALDLAVASIKTEPAGMQVRLLKEHKGLIDVIPTDMRIEMIAQAEGHAKNDQALILANSITSKGGEGTERLKAADTIKDPSLREQVKEQIQVDLAREKRAKAETEYNAYDELKKGVIAGKSPAEVMKENPDRWNSMSADQQQSIQSMATGGRKTSDLAAYDEINQAAKDDPDRARVLWMSLAHLLSDTDNKKWSDRFAKPEELDGFVEREKRLELALGKVDVKDKKSEDYKNAQDQVDKDYQQFQKDKGRKPNVEELDKLIKGVTDTVVEGGWFGVGEKKGYEVTPDVRAAKAKVTKFDGKIAELEKILSAKNGGKSVSISEVERAALYKKWDAKGALND